MFVQIKEIRESAGLWKSFVSEEEFECSDCRLDGPLKLDLKLTNAGTRILVQGTVWAQVKVECARCNEDYSFPLEVEIEESFIPADSPEADVSGLDALEVLTYMEDRIVLDEMLRQNLLAAVPLQPVCRERQCQGLCDQCGANLNTEPCDCEKEDIDPRWAALGEIQKRSAAKPSLN